MEKWYQSISRRCSIGAFRSSLTPKQLTGLQTFADSLESNGIRIAVGRSSRIFPRHIFSKITGTDCFAAIISKNGRDIYSGMIGEFFILECVSRGFGTHWLGASFKLGAAQDAIELEPDESIVAVTPLGIADEEFAAGPRKSIQKLTGYSVHDFRRLPKWQQCAVESARYAPSAMNKQPWEFEIDTNSVTIINISDNCGYGLMDMGAAMMHIELGAAHCGVSGEWEYPEDYVARFVIDEEIDELGTDEEFFPEQNDGDYPGYYEDEEKDDKYNFDYDNEDEYDDDIDPDILVSDDND